MEFDGVAYAGEPVVVVPDGECVEGADGAASVVSGGVDALVEEGAAEGGGVVGPRLFEEDEACLAGAVGVVLQGGEGDLGEGAF
ncbi:MULTISPECIES: hypothetical protein [Streptomyces]|uniref:hypothetical protein n=1 Tax=Streptomyces TaxID=1883 RepID=UPI00249F44EC|nr:hypothetical protein [Streptomyces sp. Root55]